METAVRRAGVDRDVLDAERLQQIDDDVGAKAGRALWRPPRSSLRNDLRYLATPRFSASATNESSIAFVTSKSLAFAFVATSVSRVAWNVFASTCG